MHMHRITLKKTLHYFKATNQTKNPKQKETL